MISQDMLSTTRELDGGRITLKELPIETYKELDRVRSRDFLRSEFGFFGVEEKIILMMGDWENSERVIPHPQEVIELSCALKKRIKKRTRKVANAPKF